MAAAAAASASAFAPAPACSGLGLGVNVRATSARSAPVSMGLALGETFPADAAAKLGVKGKDAVVYFYGADGSPSCTKEAVAFDAANAEFKALKFEVVGVRSDKESKGEFAQRYSQRFVSDVDNSVRKQLGIKADLFGALAGRETYVIDKSGTVKLVFNSQFKPEEHVAKALEVAQLAASANKSGRQGSFFANFRLPSLGGKKNEEETAAKATTAAPARGGLRSMIPSFGGQKDAAPAAPAAGKAAAVKLNKSAPARGGLRSIKR